MNEKNKIISILRVISMLAIIILHIFSYFGIYEFGILNVFIYVFFLISGYLFSKKIIDNKKEFIKKRIKKILLPLWVWSLFLSLYVAIFKKQIKLAATSFLISLFNLNGLDYFFFGHHILDKYQIEGITHCWFVTAIFVCYLIMVAIKDTKIETKIENNLKSSLTISLAIQILLAIFINVQISGIITFFIGYFYFSKQKPSKQKSIALFFCTLIFGLIRIYLHTYIDEKIFYDQTIQPYFNMLASAFILTTSTYLFSNNQSFNKIVNKICNNRLFVLLEENSYFLFITHFTFIYGPLNIMMYIKNKPLQICCFVVLSIISAYIINHICKRINHKI